MDKDNRASKPLQLLACSILFIGVLGGGVVLFMWGFSYGSADDFENGRAYNFTTLDEPIGYIAVGVMLVSALASLLISRKVNSTQQTK